MLWGRSWRRACRDEPRGGGGGAKNKNKKKSQKNKTQLLFVFAPPPPAAHSKGLSSPDTLSFLLSFFYTCSKTLFSSNMTLNQSWFAFTKLTHCLCVSVDNLATVFLLTIIARIIGTYAVFIVCVSACVCLFANLTTRFYPTCFILFLTVLLIPRILFLQTLFRY